MRRTQEAEKDERRKSYAICCNFLFLEILKVIENRDRYIFAADGSFTSAHVAVLHAGMLRWHVFHRRTLCHMPSWQ